MGKIYGHSEFRTRFAVDRLLYVEKDMQRMKTEKNQPIKKFAVVIQIP